MKYKSNNVLTLTFSLLLLLDDLGWLGQCLANGSQCGGWVDRCRELVRGRETGEIKSTRERSVKMGIPQRMVSRMLKVDHTSITCVIKGSLMLCSKAMSYTI